MAQQAQAQQAHAQQQRAAAQVAGLTAVSNMAGFGCLAMVLAPIFLVALIFVFVCIVGLIQTAPLLGIGVAIGLVSAVLLGIAQLLKVFGK